MVRYGIVYDIVYGMVYGTVWYSKEYIFFFVGHLNLIKNIKQVVVKAYCYNTHLQKWLLKISYNNWKEKAEEW